MEVQPVPVYDVTVAIRVTDHSLAYAAELTMIKISLQWCDLIIFNANRGTLQAINEMSTRANKPSC